LLHKKPKGIAMSPFRSERQRRWLWVHRPDIARRWSKKYGSKPKPKRKKK
jgi:hypothetical protein